MAPPGGVPAAWTGGVFRDRHRARHLPEDRGEPWRQDLFAIAARSRIHVLLHVAGDRGARLGGRFNFPEESQRRQTQTLNVRAWSAPKPRPARRSWPRFVLKSIAALAR